MTNDPPTNAIASLAHPGADGLRDIRPPVEIPSLWPWIGLALGIVALTTMAFLAWKYWLNRRTHPRMPPPIPAHVRAKLKLQQALALIARPEPFCTLVSNTIRLYLEEQFTFHAPERTTEEFLYELQDTNLLSPDQKESLGDFLKRCDLVKFARYEPGEPELRNLHASAVRLVEETEPFPDSPAANAPDRVRNAEHATP